MKLYKQYIVQNLHTCVKRFSRHKDNDFFLLGSDTVESGRYQCFGMSCCFHYSDLKRARLYSPQIEVYLLESFFFLRGTKQSFSLKN